MPDCHPAEDIAHQDAAIRSLLRTLGEQNYTFVTPTPASHARVVARPDKREARGLTDIFGWNLPFARYLLDPALAAVLEAGGLLETESDGLTRSKVRVSALRETLYIHSSYPTIAEDAVFFGPDSYRFANLIADEVPGLGLPDEFIAADIGTGAGVGAVVIKQIFPAAGVIGTDINRTALRFAAANAEVAGAEIELVAGDTERALGLPLDLVVANPPYIIDTASRTYRDGGGLHGAQVAIDMVRDMLGQLSSRGWLILYTGTAIVDGRDRQRAELEKLAAQYGKSFRYTALDPDVFGEELAREVYRDVDRIELVAAILGPEGS